MSKKKDDFLKKNKKDLLYKNNMDPHQLFADNAKLFIKIGSRILDGDDSGIFDAGGNLKGNLNGVDVAVFFSKAAIGAYDNIIDNIWDVKQYLEIKTISNITGAFRFVENELRNSDLPLEEKKTLLKEEDTRVRMTMDEILDHINNLVKKIDDFSKQIITPKNMIKGKEIYKLEQELKTFLYYYEQGLEFRFCAQICLGDKRRLEGIAKNVDKIKEIFKVVEDSGELYIVKDSPIPNLEAWNIKEPKSPFMLKHSGEDDYWESNIFKLINCMNGWEQYLVDNKKYEIRLEDVE